MDLKQLRYFTSIIDEGSVSAASEQVHISQPALTMAIKNLEKELGVQLFAREGKRLHPTKEGYHFYKHARGLLAQAEKAKADMASLKSLKQAEIRVAAPTMVAGYVLAKPLTHFMQTHPGIRMTISQMGGPKVEKALLRGDIDLGFVTRPPLTADINTAEITATTLSAYVRPGHPLASKKHVDWPDILPYQLATLARSYVLYENIQKQAAKHRIRAEIILESDVFPILIAALKQSDMVGLFLKDVAAHVPDLSAIPVYPEGDKKNVNRIPILASHLKGQSLTLAAKALLSHLTNSFRP